MVDRRSNEEKRMNMPTRSTFPRLAALIVTVAALLALSAGPAHAIEPGFKEFKMTPSSTQAGGHPDLSIYAEFETGGFGSGELALRRFKSHTPTGFIGNPHVAPKCTLVEYTAQNCPVDSQIGIVYVASFGIYGIFFPLYNMETRPDQAGLLAFTTPLISTPVFIELSSRTDSDYGLDASTSAQVRVSFPDFETILWGVPADPVHNKHRFFTPLKFLAACLSFEEGCPGETFAEPSFPERPFLQNPTECGVPLTSSGDIEYYEDIEVHAEAEYPPTTGCNQLSFDPSIAAKPTTPQTDSPSGGDVDIRIPQTQSPTTPSPSELRTTRVTMPEGFTINPGAADGKVACLDGQTSMGTLFAAQCPEFSKIGTLSLDVAALPGPLPGALYLGEPKPGDQFRVVLVADGFATHVKLFGSARPDPQTGQVTIVFENLPQSPMQEFDLHIFGSERGLFATPERCGTVPIKTEFVPWNGNLETRHALSFMTFDSGPNGTPCPVGPRPFTPTLQSGVSNTQAGTHAPFSLILNRDDGEQNLTGVTVNQPPGFGASLKGIPYCPESAIQQLSNPDYAGLAEQASSACPAASLVGTATSGAGSGTHPVYTAGKVYLAGPYKGAPLSLVTVVPAVSGPYDLGNVAVRIATRVDPVSARITAVSDALPQIVEGVPLRLRSLLLNLNRPGFTLNPTNCDPAAVTATVTGDEGGVASLSNHFQVANCADLTYAPKFGLRLSGGVKRRGHPAIRATFSAAPGESNTRRISVALPKGQQLDQAHIGTVCTRPQFAADNCPAGSMIGSAEASTPLLDNPIKGNVYLRSSSNELPDMVMDLEGQIDIELIGRIDAAKGGELRTTFDNVPDAPVSSFTVNLLGGSKGLVVNTESLCKKPKRATVKLRGQNGAVLNRRTKLQTSCGSSARKKRTGKRHSDQRKAG